MVEVDDVTTGLSEVGEIIGSSTPTIVWIAIFLGIAFGVVVGIIYGRRKFDFIGSGEPLGHYLLVLMGKYPLEVNLAEWDEIDDRQLDLLAKSPNKNFQVFPEVMRQMREDKSIFIYPAKITDDSEREDEEGKRTFIVSPYDLDDKRYYFKSQKSRFTFRSIFQKERTRVVVSLEPTDIIPVFNEDKNFDEWIFLVPVPRDVKPKQLIGFNSKVITDHSYYIETRQINHAEKLAYAGSYMPTFIQMTQEYGTLEDEFKSTEELVGKKTQEVISKQQIIDKKNFKLGGKVWVINSKEKIIQRDKISWVFVFAGVISGAISPLIVGSFLPNTSDTVQLSIGIVLALVGVGIGFHISSRQKKDNEDEETVTEETS